MPLMVTISPSILATRQEPLGKVSVVMIASAAARQPPEASRSIRLGKCGVSRSASRGTPMTPVEAMKTSADFAPTRAAACSAIARVAFAPTAPVNAFELPALTTRARALPLPRRRASRHQSTGAPGIFERVNTPGRRRARREHGDHQIVALLVLIAGFHAAERHARNGEHIGKLGRSERRKSTCGNTIRFRNRAGSRGLYGSPGAPASGRFGPVRRPRPRAAPCRGLCRTPFRRS